MARNLVICCDGTNNQFGANNTNVVRLFQVLDRDPLKQRVYYDPGVGTLPEPGYVTRLGRFLSDLSGLAFGGGLLWKVQEAYSYLMTMWQPGDRVFLFGFSRGAYTVRVLAGLLHELGLLPRGTDNLIPYVTRLFKTAKKDHDKGLMREQSPYWRLRDEFRGTFARAIYPGDQDRRFPVHFMGVWDTVSSVGWVWDPPKFPYSTHNSGIGTFRHAVSIDERRWFFRQNLMQPVPESHPDFLQLWFAGVHCDVGGGYPDSGLWRNAFEWMLSEAAKAGLALDPDRLAEVRENAPAAPWKERQHESLTPAWWPAEFFPKLCRPAGSSVAFPAFGLGRHRHIQEGEVLHKSALLRIRDGRYAPPNLSTQFVESVRSLQEIPDSLAYQSKPVNTLPEPAGVQ